MNGRGSRRAVSGLRSAESSRQEPPPRGAAAEKDPTTHFGFREIAAAEKGARVRGLFERVAGRYDLMNDLMSGGVHRLWKEALVDRLDPRPDLRLLDVAGGTGDIAFRVAERLGEGLREPILVCDLTEGMLAAGRDRAAERGLSDRLAWLCGDAQSLPLPDRSVTAYTIAFGLRNVTDIDLALAEARRVLRPGGRFLCLEFSQVVLPVLAQLYDIYSFRVLPAMGAAVAGDRDAYAYLVESIRRFPAQEALCRKIAKAGFDMVRYRNLTGGIAALHTAWRL